MRKYLFSAAAAAAAAAALQMVAWKTLYGAFLLIPQGGSFLGAEFHGLATVFSTDRGILLWAPIMIVSLFGLWPLAARKSIRPVFTAVVLAVVFQWLINSALSDPGGGDAFGPRRFVELAPFLVLPLAALAARFPRTVLIAVVLTTVCTGFLLAAFRDGFLPRSGEFDWPAAWERFFSR
ncbi:MAG TPA: hypothetical protein ENJ77_00570 [Candidatus Moranbacteria bacterium]|nr:hypothetical protein [Candidatus Moranbacteria bacterium]